ncbi:hypothetical protein LEP1GSC151_2755 [Leptospira interrogans serovar Grippotyphosa str. LT2186]|uniref:GHKL domain protein n=1 Tax=Leptospira interrogans serovar Grippotyphosa str. LT2186 TaxID=1001599 RepID=M3HHU7_LEPIR|nr:hypothetical protein LEP1GSC151_2755 [Leptospira interrogans serovar Grippotyphosa str. LT2186]
MYFLRLKTSVSPNSCYRQRNRCLFFGKNYFIDLFRTFHSSEELSGAGTGLFFAKRLRNFTEEIWK